MYKGGFNMASYTQHYQLHQWEPNDNFLRTDFNEDLEKIDTALGECSHIRGSYIGSGVGGANDMISVDIGFTPSLVVVISSDSADSRCSGYFVYPANNGQGAGGKVAVEWSATGLTWGKNDAYTMLNIEGVHYHYIAFR